MLRNALVAVSLLFVGGFVVALVNAQDLVRRSAETPRPATGGGELTAGPAGLSAVSGDNVPDPTSLAEPASFPPVAGAVPVRSLSAFSQGNVAARQASASETETDDGLQSVLKRQLQEPSGDGGPSGTEQRRTSSRRTNSPGTNVEEAGDQLPGDQLPGEQIPDEPSGFRAAGRAEASPLRAGSGSSSDREAAAGPAERLASRPRVSGEASPSVALVTSESPAIRVEALGPASISLGKEATYTVRAWNQSDRPATGLIVRVVLPRTIQVAGMDASAGDVERKTIGLDAGHLVWNIDQIAAGSNAQLEVKLVPQQAHPFPLGVEWSFRPLVARTEVQVQEPKLDISISGPKDILYGETKIYTLTLTNPGTGDAENVTVMLGNSPTTGATKQLGTLAAGERRELDVELTAREAGTMEIQALAQAESGLRAEAATSVQVRRAQLEVQVAGPERRFANSEAVYEIRVANVGDAVAQDVVAAFSLPEGARYVGGAAGASTRAGRIQWPVGLLNPGSDKVFRLQFELMLPGENRFEARVLATGDLAAADSCVTRVEALADLKLLVNDPRGPKSIGEEVAYEVTVVNRGTKSGRNITIVAQFSEGIEPVRVEGGKAELFPGQVVFQPITEIGSGERVVLKVIAKAEKEGNHVFRAEVTCGDPETRLVTEETTRYFASGVLGP